MLPVLHAPVLEVDVWVTEPLLVQVMVSPTLIMIEFGVKHPRAGGQLTIWADEFAASATVGIAARVNTTPTPSSSLLMRASLEQTSPLDTG